MKISQRAIENHQFTTIMIILLVLLGIISFFTMPRSEDPQVAKAGASVVVLYPGANPTDMEELAANPIEEALNELEDIKEINSISEDGLSLTTIEFLVGTDPDEKYSDVVQKVNGIRDELPDELAGLSIKKWGISDVNILQIALLSPYAPYRQLEEEAERLKRKLEKVNGVRKVSLWAFPEQEVRIALNFAKMAQLNIPLRQVYGAIQSANMNIPGGNMDLGSKSFSIQTSGRYRSIDDIRNTIIHSSGSMIVHLRDIAEIDFDYQKEFYHARFNGHRAVFITANQKERTNIFDIMKELKLEIEQFRTQLPASVSLHYVLDQSQSVSRRVNGFFINLFEGILLVGMVIFAVMSFRASVIVMLAIPISIFIGIGFIDLSGYGLEQMSIAGLVIALGILVDNAIVVTQNISRFLKSGFGQKEAAAKATEQIAWAIVSATVTTVLAFVPMMMIGDITGDFIRSMPVTVVFTLGASLLVALTMTPYLSSRYLNAEDMRKERKIQRALGYIIENPYRRTLNYVLEHRKKTIIITLAFFLGSLALFPLVGISFFPKAEKPHLFINIDTPDGTSLDKTDEVTADVEKVLALKDEIDHYAANIGRGNPRVYYNVIEKERRNTHAQIYIELKKTDLRVMAKLIRELRGAFSDYPNARIEVKELEQGPPVEAPIAIKVLGENLNILKEISRDIEAIISSTEGSINVDNPLRTSKTDLYIHINRVKAGMLGIPLVDIDRTIRTCIAGVNISKFRDVEGKEYDIVLRLPVDRKAQMSDFDRIYLTSIAGSQIPLKQIASVEFRTSPQKINHFNLERSVTLTADVVAGYSVDKITRDIIARLEKYEWPKDYRYYIGGELESRGESFGGMLRAIVFAMFGIFAVLVLQFRSISQPLIVLSAIPLAIIGSVFALLITGYTFSFTAFVGLTSLVGIVVNNSIILVDYTNQLRGEGTDLIQALKEAGETRFTPILLTTGTTIGGLLPLTLQGGTLWAPMGWTIIGGLATSTFLTLIFVPVLYSLYSKDEIE